MLEPMDWIGLALAPRIGAVLWGRLMRDEAGAEERRRCIAAARAQRAAADAVLQASAAGGATVLTPADAAWPERLRQLADPPAVLFCRGDPALLAAPQLAVVGARRASRRALEDTRWLVTDLAAAGLVITSGLALGVDGCAHAAALDAGGGTVALLGSGLDHVHPARHRPLAEAVAGRGLLATEFPPGTPPLPAHFPRRNRLISGLSLGVLVIEAGERSGSMITARLAATQGRDVFAVPATPRDRGAAGCLRLLREGAVLVRDAGDVFEELGIAPAPDACGGPGLAAGVDPPVAPSLDERALRVLACLAPEGVEFDALLACCGLGAAELAAQLTDLEVEGLVLRDASLVLPAAHLAGGAPGPVP